MSYRAVSSGGDATDAQAVEGPGGQALTHALRRRAAVRNLPLAHWHTHTEAQSTQISDEWRDKGAFLESHNSVRHSTWE